MNMGLDWLAPRTPSWQLVVRPSPLPFSLLAIITLAILGGAPRGLAQTVSLGRQEFIQRVWRTEDGLPQNTVTALVQTRDGYLWAGTFGGLARFDGVRFTIFSSSNTPALKSNRIVSLVEDRLGALWIISEQGTLTQYVSGRFTDYTSQEGMPAGDIQCVLTDSHADFWVGTSSQGIFQFRAGRLIKRYTTQDGLPSNTVRRTVEDRTGTLWVCLTGGLTKIQGGRLTTYTTKDGLPSNDVTNLLESRDGSLWIVTADTKNSWISRFRDNRFTSLSKSFGIIPTQSASLSEDPAGALWVAGYDSGLHRWKEGNQDSFTVKEGLESSYIRAVIQDREGNLWFSPEGGGLVRWREKKLTTYSKQNGLARDDVTSIIEDTAGTIWVGNLLLSQFRQGTFVPSPVLGDAEFVRALFVDEDGSLWFNRSVVGGAELVRLKDGRPTQWPFPGGGINAIYRDRSGRLWLGAGAGLSEFVNGQFIFYGAKEGMLVGLVVFIYEDRQGALWFGSTSGLSRFKDGQFTNYTTQQGLSYNFVRAVYEDADGTLWLGTYGGGLNRFRNGRFVPLTTQSGLIEDIVSRILTDDDDNFWLSGNRGIYRVSRHELNEVADGRQRAVNPVSYGVDEGMLTSETNGGIQPAGWRTRDGRLWFPTIKGIVVIDPKQRNELPPPVAIEQVVFDKQPLDLRGDRVAPPGNGDLEIQYTGLCFSAPEKVRFKYRLEGYDHDWIEAGTRRSAYYTKIPPGHYTFHVLAANNDGVWNETGALLSFKLKPHFYQTWLFYGLSACSLAGLGFAAYRWRVQQLQERLQHEQQIAVRLLQVDKLKDEFLANTSHELRTPLNGIIGLAESLMAGATGHLPATTNSNLALIAASGKRLTALVNDLLDFSKLRHHELSLQLQPVDLRALTEVVLTLSRPLGAGKPLQLLNAIPPGLPLVKADENRVEQILFNLIGNAIKFTAAGTVTVAAQPAGEFVEVTVTDTGCGIPKDKHELIFESFEQADASTTRAYGGTGLGLAVTRQLVELHGGTIHVASEVGLGAQFRFTLPLCLEQTPVRRQPALSETSTLVSKLLAEPLPEVVLPTVAAPAPPPGAPPARILPARILVVDDEPINLQVLKNHLLVEHYDVTTALNGAEALALLAHGHTPDLILLDVMMPGLSGYEVCTQLRTQYSADELPIIILTAKTQVDDLVAGLASGANDFLTKPVGRAELLARLRTHLALADANRELREARDRLELKVHERTEQLRQSNDQLLDANEQLNTLNAQLAEVNQQLEQANDNLLAVFNRLRIGAVLTDAAGCIAFVSQTAETLLDCTQAEMLGKSWDSVLPLPASELAKLRVLATLPAKQRTRLPVSLQPKAGQPDTGRRYWAEIEVQDDPRDARRRLFFLYDVSEVFDLRRLLDERAQLHGLVGESAAMQLVFKQIRDIARLDSTVLLGGETGTGKELVARAIHQQSARRDKAFVAVNCAGLTETLLTSQLFGHKRGAFTGAVTDQLGLFEAAQGGTLFLDEIGDIPLNVQTALLRVLQEREITRLGENKPRPVEVRIIAATHRDLAERVAAGQFREDFLYRIRVARIQLPPLRDRLEDLPLLVAWFLREFRVSTGRPDWEIGHEAMELLLAYGWPGNIRELRSALEHAVIHARGPVLQPTDLPPELFHSAASPKATATVPPADERQRILQALAQTGGNRMAAARLLGISRATLYRRLADLGIRFE